MQKLVNILMLPTFFIQRLKTHWQGYKTANQHLQFPFITYVFGVLLYRRLVCYFVAIPLVGCYFFLYPFIKLRFLRLIDSAIGHYTVNTECLLSKLDALKNDNFINIFYLEHSSFTPPVCNMYLHKMWQRIIYILPTSLTPIVENVDKILMFFLSHKAYGLWGEKNYLENRGADRDIHGYLKKSPPHLKFSEEEHERARKILEKINIKPTDRYICLLVRSSAYNRHNPSWNMLPARNSNLSTYIKAARFLAEKGYYVLRMGKIVDDKFETNHPRIIDYASSDIRSDFMDVYLSAHCHFFITTGTGLDGVAQIFQRPIMYTNCFMSSYVGSWYPHYLFIPKLVAFQKTQKLLTFKQEFHYLCDDAPYKDPPFHYFYSKDYLKKHGLYFVDNTEDEILDIVMEMEARMMNTWHESNKDKVLQEKYWNIFPIKTICSFTNRPLHGEISIKMGAKFLSKYQHLLDDDASETAVEPGQDRISYGRIASANASAETRDS